MFMRITMREEDLVEAAAAAVRQAVALARRRGHAQVSPLHLASAMLSPASSSLRAACVSSQSHPLQHHALELCLDVALGRLAAVTHHGPPELAASNAFCVALRRAQRLGAGGKVELEHLAVSVLDDPGVDRVMREAGFSSSQLRACVQNAAALSPQMQSDRAPGCGGVVTAAPLSSLDPVAGKIRSSGGQQPSLRIVGQELPRETLAATTSILPPWLRRYQDTIPTATGATRCGFSSLPVDVARRQPKFTELNAQNLKILCDALELRCPGHGDIVPSISTTLLWIRSGMMMKQRIASLSSTSTVTWLLFLGRDSGGKTAIARELANLVFGSYTDFITMFSAPNVPTPSGKLATKRQRSLKDGNGGYDVGERFFEAILENPHRVILIDGVDQMDRDLEMRIKMGIIDGAVVGGNGDMVRLEDAIVVLSSRSVVSSPRVKRRLISRQDHEDGEATGKKKKPCPCLSLDLSAGPEDGEVTEEVKSADNVGILNVVDGVFFFN